MTRAVRDWNGAVESLTREGSTENKREACRQRVDTCTWESFAAERAQIGGSGSREI